MIHAQARIAHRLRDGTIWASRGEPWKPLDVDGSMYNRIKEEIHTMHLGGGYDNVHQLMAFLPAEIFPHYGALVSSHADGDILVLCSFHLWLIFGPSDARGAGAY